MVFIIADAIIKIPGLETFGFNLLSKLYNWYHSNSCFFHFLALLERKSEKKPDYIILPKSTKGQLMRFRSQSSFMSYILVILPSEYSNLPFPLAGRQ